MDRESSDPLASQRLVDDDLPSGVTSPGVARRPSESDDSAPGYTIDELAAETGVPSRTIRFYQAKGAIPPPERRGRIAYYGDEHVERLELVAELQERGLHLKAIRDLLTRSDGGEVSVSEWLGVGDQLRAPWSDDRPVVCDEEKLRELIGPDRSRGFVNELVDARLLRREGDAHPPSYFVKSPGLLHAVLRLHDAGFDLEAASAMTHTLRKRLGKAADEIAGSFLGQPGASGGASAKELSAGLDTLRTAGLDAVRLVFAQEMERAVRTLVEKGRVMPRARRRKAKRR